MNYFPVFIAILLLFCSTLLGELQAQSGTRSVSNADASEGESEEFFEFLDRVSEKKRGPFGRRKLFTRNSKGQISELRLRGVKLREGDLAIVSALRHLERLDLSDSNVQDMQLIHLAGLSILRELNLFQTKIGDSALVHLSTLDRIERLNLGRTRVTDEGLSSLKELNGLRHLALRECGITDAGAKQLAGLIQLVSLKLGETKITDRGLLELQTLDKLRSLTLDQTAITAEALMKFAQHAPKRFAWITSPKLTIKELVRRMERAEFDAAEEMVTIGLNLPKRGAFTLLKIDPLPKNAKDEKLDRQRFRLEMHWVFVPDRIAQTLFAVTAVDRGSVGVHEMGIADKPGVPKKEKAPEAPRKRESKENSKLNKVERPDGVMHGRIILWGGPHPMDATKDLGHFLGEREAVPVFTVYVGTSKIEFRRAESKAADGLEESTFGEKGEKIYLHKKADATGDDIAEAQAVKDSTGKPAIEIRFTMAGSTKIAKATTEHRGKRLAIVFNGKVISAPIIQSKISTKAIITGNFTKEEVEGIVSAIMKPKEDAKKEEGKPKTSKPDSDDTSALRKAGIPIADDKPVFQPLGHLPDLAKYNHLHEKRLDS